MSVRASRLGLSRETGCESGFSCGRVQRNADSVRVHPRYPQLTWGADSGIEPGGFFRTLAGMSKMKIPATGEGYLGEIMVHRLTRAIGVVEQVIEAKAGWTPQLTVKLADGTVRKGKLSDFREPSGTEREKFTATTAGA